MVFQHLKTTYIWIVIPNQNRITSMVPWKTKAIELQQRKNINKLFSVGCLKKTLFICLHMRKLWEGGNDSSTGSEVTAGGITEEAHSLVAAPLMRVCPEEFSVGSSRRSSGRGQTWVNKIMKYRSMVPLPKFNSFRTSQASKGKLLSFCASDE